MSFRKEISFTGGLDTNIGTIGNLFTTNQSVNNLVSTNINSTNISASSFVSNNFRTTNFTTTNLQFTNISAGSGNAVIGNLTANNLTFTFLSAASGTASIGNILSTNIISTNVSMNNVFFNNVSANSLNVVNITSSNINSLNSTIINLTSSDATINNLSSPSITTANLNSTNTTFINFYSNNITSNNNIFTNATISNINSNLANISNITSSNANLNNLISSLINSTNANFSSITTQNLNSTNTTFANLNSTNTTFINFYSNNITSNNNIFTNATISNINSNLANISNITSSNANLNNLISSSINSTNANFSSITTQNLNSTNTTFVNLNSTNITSLNINSTNTTFINLNSTNVTSLNANFSSITNVNLNSTNINSTNTTFINLNSTNVTSLNANFSSITTANLNSTNITSSNANFSSITTANLNSTNIISSNANFSSITTGKITGDLISTNITSTNALFNSITSTNVIASSISSSIATIGSLVTTMITSNNNLLTNLTAVNIGFSIMSAASGSATIGNSFIQNLSSGIATINNSTISNLISTNITGTNSLLTNLTSTNLSFTILSAGSGVATIGNLISSSLTLDNGLISNTTISNLNFTTLSAGSGFATIGNLISTNINSLNATIQNISSTNNTFNNINSTNNSMSNLLSTNNSLTNIKSSILSIDNNLLAVGNSNTIGSIFTTNGNVGIGNTSPNYKLDVSGDINFSGQFFQNSNLFTTSQWNGSVGNSISYTSASVVISDSFIGNITSNNLLITGGSLKALNNSNTIGSIFTTNGNIGIGNTAPNYNIDLNGDLNITGNLYKNGVIFGTPAYITRSAQTIGAQTISSGTNTLLFPDAGYTTGDITYNTIGSFKVNQEGLYSVFVDLDVENADSTVDLYILKNGIEDSVNGRIGWVNITPYKAASINALIYLLESEFITVIINNSSINSFTTPFSSNKVNNFGMALLNSASATSRSSQWIGFIGDTISYTSGGIFITNATTNNILVSNNFISTNSNTIGSLFTTAGNVGIGTTAPTQLLTVAGIISASSLSVDSITSTNSILSNISSSSITTNSLIISSGNLIATSSFNTIGSIYTSGGNVGIGTTSPTQTLTVSGTITSTNLATNNISSSNFISTNITCTNISTTRLDVFGNQSLYGTQQFPSYIFGNNTNDNAGLILKCGASNNIWSQIQINSNYDGATVTAGSISFWTSSSERMRIVDNGYVGINTDSPSELLHVGGNLFIGANTQQNYIAFYGTYGDIGTTFIGERIYGGLEQSELLLFKGNDNLSDTYGPDRIRLLAAEHRFDTHNGVSGAFDQVATSGTTRMIVTNTGQVGINQTSPNARLEINSSDAENTLFVNNQGGGFGTRPSLRVLMSAASGARNIIQAENSGGIVWYVNDLGAVGNPSDRRIKENIKDIKDNTALEIIRQLKPKTFNYKGREKSETVFGFIAQEVKDILNYAVTTSSNFVPNILDYAKVINKNILELKNICKIIDKSKCKEIKIRIEESKYKEVIIEEFIDEDRIKISEEISEPIVFIYGEKIEDFHFIDHKELSIVGIAALKQLDEKFQIEKKILEDRINQLEKKFIC